MRLINKNIISGVITVGAGESDPGHKCLEPDVDEDPERKRLNSLAKGVKASFNSEGEIEKFFMSQAIRIEKTFSS